jgi:hypothetical protein
VRLIGETEEFWPEALLTRDRDFSLFPELVVRNPLA